MENNDLDLLREMQRTRSENKGFVLSTPEATARIVELGLAEQSLLEYRNQYGHPTGEFFYSITEKGEEYLAKLDAKTNAGQSTLSEPQPVDAPIVGIEKFSAELFRKPRKKAQRGMTLPLDALEVGECLFIPNRTTRSISQQIVTANKKFRKMYNLPKNVYPVVSFKVLKGEQRFVSKVAPCDGVYVYRNDTSEWEGQGGLES